MLFCEEGTPHTKKGSTVRSDQLGREVNRLYWETTEPVTRLAEQLGVSRGTFYNHLQPLPATGRCSACGGALLFGTRSDRDTGTARCGSCGHGQSAARPASRRRAAATGRGETRTLHVERSAAETPVAGRDTHEAALLKSRVSWLDTPDDEEDRMRTRLLIVAVGAAVLGLGVLYYSRRNS